MSTARKLAGLDALIAHPATPQHERATAQSLRGKLAEKLPPAPFHPSAPAPRSAPARPWTPPPVVLWGTAYGPREGQQILREATATYVAWENLPPQFHPGYAARQKARLEWLIRNSDHEADCAIAEF